MFDWDLSTSVPICLVQSAGRHALTRSFLVDVAFRCCRWPFAESLHGCFGSKGLYSGRSALARSFLIYAVVSSLPFARDGRLVFIEGDGSRNEDALYGGDYCSEECPNGLGNQLSWHDRRCLLLRDCARSTMQMCDIWEKYRLERNHNRLRSDRESCECYCCCTSLLSWMRRNVRIEIRLSHWHCFLSAITTAGP